MKGGYVLIDCDGLNLLGGSTPQVKAGLYAKVKEAMDYKKEIIACNCVYGSGKPLTPIGVFALQEDANTIICTASILQVVITDQDSVTIRSLV